VGRAYHTQWVGQTVSVLFEEEKDGLWEGYTPEYIHVTAADGCQGKILPVKITGVTDEGLTGEIC